jgi:hypothetical protein
VIPATRSVCPQCGRLQKARPIPGLTDGPTTSAAPDPTSDRAGRGGGTPATWPPNAPSSVVRPSTTAPLPGVAAPVPGRATASTATVPDREPWSAPRRRGRTGLGIFLVLAIAAGAGAWWMLRDDGYQEGNTTVARVERFCGKPRALGDEVAEFVPGQPAAAHLQVPQPMSSMEEPSGVTAPASPSAGEPTLDLDASIGLVSLAVCLSEESSEPSGGNCDYELTNSDDRGRLVRAPLLATTYQAQLYELRSGSVLASGEVTTAVDECPELAYVEVEGVSNPLPAEAVVLWMASQLPGGIPA